MEILEIIFQIILVFVKILRFLETNLEKLYGNFERMKENFEKTRGKNMSIIFREIYGYLGEILKSENTVE